MIKGLPVRMKSRRQELRLSVSKGRRQSCQDLVFSFLAVLKSFRTSWEMP